MENRSILLSIKPYYAHKIFSGQKSIELRKKLPKGLEKDSLVLVYSSSPEKVIYGAFTVKKIIKDTPINLWQKVKKKSAITEDDYNTYFHNSEYGYGIVIKDYWSFEDPISLEELKNYDEKFNVPQSFRYLTKSEFSLIQYEFGVSLKII